MKYRKRKKKDRVHQQQAVKHARKRALSRLGIVLTKGENKSIVKQIRSGRATFIKFGANGKKIFEVTRYDKTFAVVYDPKIHRIVTVLRSEWVK